MTIYSRIYAQKISIIFEIGKKRIYEPLKTLVVVDFSSKISKTNICPNEYMVTTPCNIYGIVFLSVANNRSIAILATRWRPAPTERLVADGPSYISLRHFPGERERFLLAVNHDLI